MRISTDRTGMETGLAAEKLEREMRWMAWKVRKVE
jgi:hypothetical protein